VYNPELGVPCCLHQPFLIIYLILHRDVYNLELGDECFLELQSLPVGPPATSAVQAAPADPLPDKFSVHLVVRAPGGRAFASNQDVGAVAAALKADAGLWEELQVGMEGLGWGRRRGGWVGLMVRRRGGGDGGAGGGERSQVKDGVGSEGLVVEPGRWAGGMTSLTS
jgi:hypothetical protein